jgi:hypothetical protein
MSIVDVDHARVTARAARSAQRASTHVSFFRRVHEDAALRAVITANYTPRVFSLGSTRHAASSCTVVSGRPIE